MPHSAYERVLSVFQKTLTELIGTASYPSFLLGFSGGADSSLLLHFFHEEGLPIAAAHLNHGIRGSEADRDERFCRERCKALGIPFHSYRMDIPAIAAERGMGWEEAGREMRYTYLLDTAKKYHYSFLVTAHNADDNLETMLFHLARGTALKGLCGIPPKRDNVIRPLIACSKADILAACQEKDIPFVNDSTNHNTNYTRNYLRSEVIPYLRKINPQICHSVYETSCLLRRDHEALCEAADRYTFTSGRTLLSTCSDAVLSRVLIRECQSKGLSPKAKHIEEIMAAIRSSSVRSMHTLPGGTLMIDRNTIFWKEKSEVSDVHNIPLLPGFTEISCDSAFYVALPGVDPTKDINKIKNIYKLAIKAEFDSAKIDSALLVRSRHPGDTYQMGGMTRSVKKLLQSQKTTVSERSQIPFVIRKPDEILWIPGFPPADSVKPTDNCKSTISLFYFSQK